MGASRVSFIRKDRFVDHFLTSMNGVESYKKVHPKAAHRTAVVGASVYLSDPYVIDRLAEARAKLAEKTGLTAEKVIGELSNIAFADLGDIWEPSAVEGQLRMKPIAQWPENARRAIAGIKVKHYPARASKEGVEISPEYDVFEIKFWGKPETLKVLGQTLGMFKGEDDPDNPPSGTKIGTQIFIIGGQRIAV